MQAAWSNYSSGSYDYLVRRKLVDPEDRTFDGSEVVAAVSDPTRAYDDPVFDDDSDYDYEVVRKSASEELYFYHTDHLGTPIAMTDTSGVFKWKAEYRPFGDLYSQSYNDIENNLRFPGQYFDAETGLHQNYFRDYDPKIGRYREPDPIGLGGGINLFSYVRNRPTKRTDHRGLYPGAPSCGTADECPYASYPWLDEIPTYSGPGSGAELAGRPFGYEVAEYRQGYERWVGTKSLGYFTTIRLGCKDVAHDQGKFTPGSTEHCRRRLWETGWPLIVKSRDDLSLWPAHFKCVIFQDHGPPEGVGFSGS